MSKFFIVPGVIRMLTHLSLRQLIKATIPTTLLPRPSRKAHPQNGTAPCLHEFSKMKIHHSLSTAFDTMAGYDDPGPVSDAQLSSSNPETGYNELEEGESMQLPDITASPDASDIPLAADKIVGSLNYASNIVQREPPQSVPSGVFGATNLYNLSIATPTITKVKEAFQVAANVQAEVRFWMRNDDSSNIESEESPRINSFNWIGVAGDLTPGPDYKSRRNQYWARDLTIRHERFHAKDVVADGEVASMLAQKWLQSQTASSVNDIPTLLDQARVQISSFINSQPMREDLAYRDGAPAYLARANKIMSIGSTGGYDNR